MKKGKEQGIGVDVKAPKETCEDKNCPFHGTLKVRGRNFVGVVMKKDVHKTATVEWEWKKKIQKFERSESKKTRLRVHNPPCINAKIGDVVKLAECRPLSKTKSFVVIENHGPLKGFQQMIESLEEGKAGRIESENKPSDDKKKKTDSKEDN